MVWVRTRLPHHGNWPSAADMETVFIDDGKKSRTYRLLAMLAKLDPRAFAVPCTNLVTLAAPLGGPLHGP